MIKKIVVLIPPAQGCINIFLSLTLNTFLLANAILENVAAFLRIPRTILATKKCEDLALEFVFAHIEYFYERGIYFLHDHF